MLKIAWPFSLKKREMNQYVPPQVATPNGEKQLLLHACCAPCSSAIIECLLYNDIRPTVFYYNPNIYPREEYEIRKAESIRQVTNLGLKWIDGDYNHSEWLSCISGFENEPERGTRCLQCFKMRLKATAQCAHDEGIELFATTLASSRWKSLQQIEEAGLWAEKEVSGTMFWAHNWRKGGLQERRNYLLKTGGYYNQLYCGCEYSMRISVAMQKSESIVQSQILTDSQSKH